MSRWITVGVDFNELRRIPQRPGVYVLWEKNELKPCYVGSSLQLGTRVRGHANWLQLTKIRFKPSVKMAEWLMLEARLIVRLQPRLNTQWRSPESHAGLRELRKPLIIPPPWEPPVVKAARVLLRSERYEALLGKVPSPYFGWDQVYVDNPGMFRDRLTRYLKYKARLK